MTTVDYLKVMDRGSLSRLNYICDSEAQSTEVTDGKER